MHGEKIGGVGDLADERQFLFHPMHDLRRRACGIAPEQSLARQPLQPVLGGFTIPRLVRILIAQFVQAETAAGGNVDRAAQGGGIAVKEPRHFRTRFQPAFAIGQAVLADLVDGDAQPQACQHIGQRAARGAMHQHIAHRHHRQAGDLAGLCQLIEPRLIASVIARSGTEIGHCGKAAGDLHEIGLWAWR